MRLSVFCLFVFLGLKPFAFGSPCETFDVLASSRPNVPWKSLLRPYQKTDGPVTNAAFRVADELKKIPEEHHSSIRLHLQKLHKKHETKAQILNQSGNENLDTLQATLNEAMLSQYYREIREKFEMPAEADPINYKPAAIKLIAPYNGKAGFQERAINEAEKLATSPETDHFTIQHYLQNKIKSLETLIQDAKEKENLSKTLQLTFEQNYYQKMLEHFNKLSSEKLSSQKPN